MLFGFVWIPVKHFVQRMFKNRHASKTFLRRSEKIYSVKKLKRSGDGICPSGMLHMITSAFRTNVYIYVPDGL